jgi:hypothetical protein
VCQQALLNRLEPIFEPVFDEAHFGYRRCVSWIGPWPAGLIGNTKSCAVICAGRRTGSRGFPVATRSCGRTGRYACGVAQWREPYELRGSSTVLREPRGEIPRGYSSQHLREQPVGGGEDAALTTDLDRKVSAT